MARYQSTNLFPETMMKGSFKVEYAPIVADETAAAWVDLGGVDDCSFVEETTFLEGSPSNATKPDMLDGIADQKVNIGFSPWSLNPTNYMALRGGIDTLTTDADGNRKVSTGGKTRMTPVMTRFTNTREDIATAEDATQYPSLSLVAGTTAIIRVTTFIGYKCTITSGASVTGKRDDDTAGAINFPFTMQGVMDEDRLVGDQLYSINYSVVLA